MVDCLLTILVNQICRLFSTHQTPDSIITLAEGIVIPNIYHRVMYGYAGKINESVIIGKNDELFFISLAGDSFKQATDLKCSSGGNQCLYIVDPINETMC